MKNPCCNKLTNAFIRSRFEAQNRRCFYCEVELPPFSLGNGPNNNPHIGFTEDHFIPKALGGANDWSNKVFACQPCNNAKKHRLPSPHEKQRFARLNYINPPTPDVLSLSNRIKRQDS